MGEFYWPVGVWSGDRERLETVDALVDTGASYSMFPRRMLERLGIVPIGQRGYQEVDGGVIQRDIASALLVINGDESHMRVIFGEDNAGSLIGSNALQEFLLLIDPVGEQLISRTGRV